MIYKSRQEIVKKHLEDYEAKTGGLSYIKYDNPDYQTILRYGVEALPALFNSIDDHGWCVIALLSEITKANPITKEQSGKYHEVIKSWKDYGKANGYLK